MRKFLDKLAPRFEKDGKLEKFYPLYEAMDTFLYTPGEVTTGPSHVRDSIDLKRMMSMVVVALIPCVFMAMYNTGFQANSALGDTAVEGWRGGILKLFGGVDRESFISNLVHGATYFLPVYIVCMTVGGIWEVIFAIVRKHEVNEGFLVTGLLFPLTLPPTIPLWQVAIGISFGVVIGKEVFGGTGRNFLNPALTARAFLYFAHPGQITGDNKIWNAAGSTDGVSGATILTDLASQPAESASEYLNAHLNVSDSFFGWTTGSMGETSTLACLIGAMILIMTRIGSPKIMVATLLGGLGASAILNGIGSDTNPMFAMTPIQHLVTGGFAFGLVFMATDPVSASMTSGGKWIYGILIGVVAILIRVVNPAYPEGIMLAILFGNVFAPLIDYFVVNQNIKKRAARWNADAKVGG